MITVFDQGRDAVTTPERTGNALNFTIAALRGYVEVCLNAPSTGSYQLVAAVRGPSTSSNSFWVTIDTHTAGETRFSYAAFTGYQELVVGTYQLGAGDHDVRFSVREDGSFVDWMELRPVG